MNTALGHDAHACSMLFAEGQGLHEQKFHVWKRISPRTLLKYYCSYGFLLSLSFTVDVLVVIVDTPILIVHAVNDDPFEDYIPSIIAHSVALGLTLCAATWACSYSSHHRGKFRKAYGIDGSCFWDWHDHCCWDQCAICQEARHIRDEVVAVEEGVGPDDNGNYASAAPITVVGASTLDQADAPKQETM
eukprot:CAMPEP_0178397118 /NCGR_PEP_ID=MMETSP0689_2-20121128/14079_1 /TAXON_ID=160604 /ORGANISM="Amphidinium massartii, Strain CS-259" /LENGTH=188 /DNA_ID=CAMNT_0020017813 /DNA_START=119 /DNA_END=685 /DNA_ORIENTATION=-